MDLQMGQKEKALGMFNTTPETLLFLVPETGVEPVRPCGPRDFKSLASANSATPALS